MPTTPEEKEQKTCPCCDKKPSSSYVDPWSGIWDGWCRPCNAGWTISRPSKEEIDQKIVGYLSD